MNQSMKLINESIIMKRSIQSKKNKLITFALLIGQTHWAQKGAHLIKQSLCWRNALHNGPHPSTVHPSMTGALPDSLRQKSDSDSLGFLVVWCGYTRDFHKASHQKQAKCMNFCTFFFNRRRLLSLLRRFSIFISFFEICKMNSEIFQEFHDPLGEIRHFLYIMGQ